ncbi:hypothetical protein QJS10_CPB19g01247 [Acorus calamus]|uniref:Uncharacterized protein n=1 Tax=Acorus calamus TaxID=4465 RepID=A0AAV9CHC6_ACOCL|nr:hypothetical protein QJS10_CPB19g01247 [Acorus calamus]
MKRDLCQLQDLQYLDLSENSIKGNIDTCLKSSFPTQVCHMQNLHILDPSNNSLSGTIPNCLKNITSWIIDSPIDYPMDAVGRHMLFDISTDIVVTNFMTKGPIPNSFQNLENIESLDLSNNDLSGEIPSQLAKLHSLSVFRVAYNNLSGIIPYNDQFCTFNQSSFEGNPGLSGELLIKKKCWSMHRTSQTYHDSSDGDHEDTLKAIDNDVIFYSFVAASFAIGFWGVIAVLAFNKNGRMKFFMVADDFLYACMDVILGLIKRIENIHLCKRRKAEAESGAGSDGEERLQEDTLVALDICGYPRRWRGGEESRLIKINVRVFGSGASKGGDLGEFEGGD